jgi:hypothetical protein
MRGMGPCPSKVSHKFLPLRPAASRRLPCSADTSCCGVEPSKTSAAAGVGYVWAGAAAAGADDAQHPYNSAAQQGTDSMIAAAVI